MDPYCMGVIKENNALTSFHQGEKPPVCQFTPSEIGDACELTIPDVVKGTYTVRLIYYSSYSCHISMTYNKSTIEGDIDLTTADGNFEEMTTMQYKDLGNIYVDKRGDITLRFAAVTSYVVAMDMIELRPVL